MTLRLEHVHFNQMPQVEPVCGMLEVVSCIEAELCSSPLEHQTHGLSAASLSQSIEFSTPKNEKHLFQPLSFALHF